jgi:serine/threonine-protein kinase HipA
VTAPRLREPLAIWLYGTLLARLEPAGDLVRMTWTKDPAERWGLEARVMSELLPVQEAGERPHDRRVTTFLSGLLAEGNLREHQAFEAGTTSDDIFGMVSAYGRDTAGALVMLPDGMALPDLVGSWEPTSDEAIGRRLRAAGEYTPDTVESNSLAGVQPKIVLRCNGKRWFRCLEGAPSSHIVKLGHPPDSRIADVIDTEAASIELARAVGLSTIDAEVVTFDGVRALVVSRYDRRPAESGGLERIHQEDTAQALGLDTTDMNRKFQRGKSLPSLRAIAAILRNGGSEPDELLRLTTFNLAIGNSDAHAKNISLLRLADGSTKLAPAYDVAMHAHHEGFSDVFAMDVNAGRTMSRITGDDLIAEGLSWPLPAVRARRAVHGTLDRLDRALADVDRDSHPGVSADAWRVVEERTSHLRASVS